MFYVKDMSTKPKRGKNNNDPINEPKRHIVLSGKTNIVGIKDNSNISEDYEKDGRISPFTVNKDPSIQLNDEDTPWLRRDHNQGIYVKQKSLGYRFFLYTIMQNQVQEFFCNFLTNILFTRQLTTLCIFI